MTDFSHYLRFNQFKNQNILAIDFGSKVVGTALFCPGRDPFPLTAEKIIVQSEDQVLKKIVEIVSNENVEVIVYGVPFFIDGKESEQTLKIRALGEKLKTKLSSQLFFEQDETLTTKAAEDRMKNSPQYNFKVDVTKIDCVAATIILEDFIRS
jgi:putative Holliday junction resolvase